jgi:nucleoside-diphosphate kinase
VLTEAAALFSFVSSLFPAPLMSTPRTLTILKPDCVRKNIVGEVLRRIEEAGFRLRGLRMVSLSKAEAESFYAVHRERPFFDELTDFMSSGPCVPAVLEKENAIVDFRTLIGATDPVEAEEGTVRADLAGSVQENIVHGADSPENARKEMHFFFPERALVANRRPAAGE